MPKILYGNFDFEHEVELPDWRPTKKLHTINGQLTPHLIALASDGDFFFTSTEIPRAFLDAAVRVGMPEVFCLDQNDKTPLMAQFPGGIPAEHWGYSPASVCFSQRHGWSLNCPRPDAVRRVNDRAFASELERTFDCGLPGGGLIASREDLLDGIRLASEQTGIEEPKLRWVVKSRFGMASRGRILGTGTELDDPSSGWLKKQFEKNGAVQFEPWVDCDCEFSTQWVIPKNGEPPVLRGWTEIRTEQRGTPSGWLREAGVPLAASRFQSALPPLQFAVERIAAAGYFGPVGIDSMRYVIPRDCHLDSARDSGEVSLKLRPLQDINARYTMGRVAVELADRLAPNADGLWLLLPGTRLCEILNVSSAADASRFYSEQGLKISAALRRAVSKQESSRSLPDDAQAWLTSPLWIADVLAMRCGVLIASRDRHGLATVFREARTIFQR